MESNLELIVLDRVRVNEQFAYLQERKAAANKFNNPEFRFYLEFFETQLSEFLKATEVKDFEPFMKHHE